MRITSLNALVALILSQASAAALVSVHVGTSWEILVSNIDAVTGNATVLSAVVVSVRLHQLIM